MLATSHTETCISMRKVSQRNNAMKSWRARVKHKIEKLLFLPSLPRILKTRVAFAC